MQTPPTQPEEDARLQVQLQLMAELLRAAETELRRKDEQLDITVGMLQATERELQHKEEQLALTATLLRRAEEQGEQRVGLLAHESHQPDEVLELVVHHFLGQAVDCARLIARDKVVAQQLQICRQPRRVVGRKGAPRLGLKQYQLQRTAHGAQDRQYEGIVRPVGLLPVGTQ